MRRELRDLEDYKYLVGESWGERGGDGEEGGYAFGGRKLFLLFGQFCEEIQRVEEDPESIGQSVQ